jgi:hypothetical protein
MTTRPLTQGSAWNKSGSELVKHGRSGKVFLRGVTANMWDALDESWYSQLKHLHTAYRNVQPLQILKLLNTQWCPLDVKAKKMLKAGY